MAAFVKVVTFWYDRGEKRIDGGPLWIPLPSETSHRDVAVHPLTEVFVASGRSGRWYVQTQNGNRRLWLNGLLLPVQACVHLPAGEVLELRAQGSIGELEWSVVKWRAVLEVTERPAAWFSSGPSLFDALGNDELGAIIGQLGGHSTDRTRSRPPAAPAARRSCGGWRR